MRKKLEEKEDAEKVAAVKLCLDANQSSDALAMQNRRIYACQEFSEIKERLSGISEMVNISLDPLGDHKLFQLSKATDGINSDFNEVLAKITLLVSSTGVESGEFMEILNPLKDDDDDDNDDDDKIYLMLVVNTYKIVSYIQIKRKF